MKKFILGVLVGFFGLIGQSFATEVGCVSTTWRVVNNDKVCVDAFKDPDISGITCHVSFAKTGGIKGAVGMAEDPSRFSIACRQTGAVVAQKQIPLQSDTIFKERTSFIFKSLNVNRFWDKENNSLVYLVTSTKIIDGSPFNSISSVPLQPWGNQLPQMK
jgi:CreA protein